MKPNFFKIISIICICILPCYTMAQSFEDVYKQAKNIAEANAPTAYLTCIDNENVKNIRLKIIKNYPYSDYYLIYFAMNGRNYRLELPIKDIQTFIGENDEFSFDLFKMTLTSRTQRFKATFKSTYVDGGSNIAIPSQPTQNITPRNSTSHRSICQSCKGTGICGSCHGTGYFRGYEGNAIKCEQCTPTNGRKCSVCNGTGYWD